MHVTPLMNVQAAVMPPADECATRLDTTAGMQLDRTLHPEAYTRLHSLATCMNAFMHIKIILWRQVIFPVNKRSASLAPHTLAVFSHYGENQTSQCEADVEE